MHAAIIANGEFEADDRLRTLWRQADLRIAADGGAGSARRELEPAPDAVIGDMDSLDNATREWLDARRVEFIRHPRAKDQTDLELALNLAAARGATEATILGALGGRIDHLLANVLLLARAPNVRLASAECDVWAARGLVTLDGAPGDAVSLIPLDARIEGIVTTGLEYPLRSETLERGSTRGISNVMQGPRAQVAWRSGLLLVVHLFGGQQ